jgi:dTDP-4-dehydrorhamnose reductase
MERSVKTMVTGMNGTVAPALAKRLERDGHAIVAWKRAEVSPDDPSAIRDFILRTGPDWFFHVATGNPKWAETIAQVCAERGIKLLFTGSVSVFADTQRGPFSIEAVPEPNDDYGRYKLKCERLVRAANPEALIARLGWQIGTAPGSNNMIDYLDRTHREKGQVEASAKWIPSTAFLEDTVDALARLMESYPKGLYQLEGNPDGLSFFEVVTGLNRLHRSPWKIVKTDAPHRDNRMQDSNMAVRPLTERLRA